MEKKTHTIKTQIIVDKKTKLIICIQQGKGKEHDFTVFKKSKIKMANEIEILADKGYQGINKFHGNSKIPFKKTKKKKLSKEQKKFNKELNKERVVIEHINRQLKIFRILSSRYRNRRRKFGLRFNLIAGIYNYELKLQLLLVENN